MALIDDLLSYWKLDEGSGNAADSHGTHTGTPTGVTYSQAGIIGTSYLFGATDDVTIADHADFDIADGSFSFWLYPTDTVVDNSYFIYKDVAGFNDDFFILAYSGGTVGKVSFLRHDSGTSSSKIITANDALAVTAWTHVVVTWGSNGMKMYINGTLQNDTDANTGGIAGSSSALYFGNQQYPGRIDEVALFTADIGQSGATALYNSGSGLAYPLTEAVVGNLHMMGANF